MYGMVLVMALSGAGDAPACHFSFKHHHAPVYSGCHGCYGGGCYGGGCYGGSCYGGGCYGGSCYGGACYGGGCYGGACYGAGCYGGCVGVVVPMTPVKPGADKVPLPDKKPDDKKPDDKPKINDPPPSSTAKVVITLPADAALTFGDFTSKSQREERTIELTSVESGKVFSYTLRAEIVRDGQTLTASQTITVRAGQEQRVAFDLAKFGSSVVAK